MEPEQQQSKHPGLRLWPQKLSMQMIVLYLTLLATSMTAFAIHSIMEQSRHRAEHLILQAKVLAENLAATTADYLLVRDYTSLELALMRSARFPGVVGIQICDSRGKLLGDVIHAQGSEPEPRYAQPPLTPPELAENTVLLEGNLMIVWQPVILGEPLGWIKIQYSMQAITEELAEVWSKNSVVALVILLFTGLLLMLALRRPVSNIRMYTRFAERLIESKGTQIPVDNKCLELKTLGKALNTVSSRLQEQSIVIKTGLGDLSRMAAFAEHSPGMILSLDKNCEIHYINPAGYRVLSQLGVDEEGILEILPPKLPGLIAQIIRTQTPTTDLQVAFQTRTLVWTLAPVRGQEIIHAYGEDITEARQVEEEARAALVEKLSAESANRAKSQFLANMSHELRTPLNAILGYSQMLEEEVAEEGQEHLAQDLQKIQSAGKHLLTVINEILDLSKIEAGRMELYLEEFNLDELLQDVIDTAQPLAADKGNRLEVHCSGRLGQVRSDATKLRQILFNLISNAVKFTQNGQISVYCAADKMDGRDWFTFEVQDTGIGMKAEELGRLFRPFSQADNSTTRKYGGTGLGLAITKRFCEMLGGGINVISESGTGTTFSVRLPAIVLDSGEPHPISTLTKATVAAGSDTARDQSQDTVLVIDDDPQILELIKFCLNNAGYHVETAASGQKALALARAVRPRLITLDVMMPGMDGWTVLKRLKEDPQLHGVPVLILTTLEEQSLGYALGADDYLFKPIDLPELRDAVARLLAHKPLARHG